MFYKMANNTARETLQRPVAKYSIKTVDVTDQRIPFDKCPFNQIISDYWKNRIS